MFGHLTLHFCNKYTPFLFSIFLPFYLVTIKTHVLRLILSILKREKKRRVEEREKKKSGRERKKESGRERKEENGREREKRRMKEREKRRVEEYNAWYVHIDNVILGDIYMLSFSFPVMSSYMMFVACSVIDL